LRKSAGSALASSRIQEQAGGCRSARFIDEGGRSADPSRKDELKLQLAQFDANTATPRRPSRPTAKYSKKKDQNSFHSYLSFLQNHGFDREAHEFFVANKEGGYLEQYRGQEVFTLCLNASDYASPLDLNWRFTRYGERWNRDQFFNQIAKLFSDRGKFPLLLEDLQTRITAETNQNQLLRQKLAEAWTRGGQPEKAGELYDEVIKANPFNRSAISAKAQLLVKLGQDDEAIALLREMKGVQSLQDEMDARFELIEILARLNKPAEAEQELDALLAWAQGSTALERAANVYRDMKNWAKAAELFEQSRKVLRNWNYNQLLFHLGQCYANWAATTMRSRRGHRSEALAITATVSMTTA
jgi:tetratricopeptide (TPR) repeat protein